MKRFLNGLSLLLVLLFLTVVLLGAYFLPILAEMKPDELNVDVLMNRDLHISFASLVVMLMIILAFVRVLWVFIRNCANNVKNAGDDLFAEIDNWYRTKRNNKFYYDMGIQIVNCLYRNNAEIDLLIKNKEGHRLQKRKEYLEGQLEIWGEFHQCILAVMQSVVAAWLVDSLPSDNWLITLIFGSIIVLLILGMPLVKYSRKLPLLSKFEKAILEYELGYVNRLIDEYHSLLVVPENKEPALYTQRAVILELTKRLDSAKRKEQAKIRIDIEQIEGLNLVDYDEANSRQTWIDIGEYRGCLVYKKVEGLSNNYVGESNLVSEDYTKLYGILHEYRMFTYADSLEKT